MTTNQRKEEDMEPAVFADWTSINLSHCIDFMEDLIITYGDMEGRYDSLLGIQEALMTNQKYAERFKLFWENKK